MGDLALKRAKPPTGPPEWEYLPEGWRDRVLSPYVQRLRALEKQIQSRATAPFQTLSLGTAADASPLKTGISRWRRAAQGVKATVDLMNGLLHGEYFLYLGRHIL